MWLFVSILGYAMLAVVSILDKFIVSDEKIHPLKVVFYSTAPLLPALVFIPLGVGLPTSFLDIGLVLLSGFSFGLGLWSSYIGFENSEVSHVGPLVGAAVAFFVLVLGQIFLQESISSRQVVAIAILICGSLLISFEKSNLHIGWHRGMLWGVLAGFLYAVSNISAKHIYDAYGFYSGLVLTRGAIGLFGGLLLVVPAFEKHIFRTPSVAYSQNANTVSRNKKIFTVVADKVLGVFGVILVQYATALGSVSVVNALVGVQYALLVVLVFAFSKYLPRVFREDFKPGEMAQEFFAVVLIAIGLGFLVF